MNEDFDDFDPMDYQGRSKKQVETNYQMLKIWAWSAVLVITGLWGYMIYKLVVGLLGSGQ